MRSPKKTWLAWMLATTALCTGSTIAWSQEIQPAYGAGNSDYATAAGMAGPVPGNRVVPASTFSANQPPADWESWKAEVDAKLKKIADSEAAAKKKAAGKPSVKVGGRIFADWYGYDQDAASVGQIGNQANGFRFDTVRIFASGSAFHVVDYKVQFDFAGTQSATTGAASGGAAHTHSSGTLQAPTFKDVYITVKELPLLGHVKVGHYKEPFSLNQLTSSRFIMFMERSVADAFTPQRNVGIMAYDTLADDNVTWAIGAFVSEIGDEPPIFRNDSRGTAVTMRSTWTPWYDEATSGRGLFHLGAAYSYRDIADGGVQFRSRPEADLGDYVLDTGTIGATSAVELVGLEAAFLYGPFRFQSEYMKSFVSRAGADPEFDGAYAQVSYFLTGEQRKYKRSAGTFSDRVVPYENFFRVRDCDGNVQTGRGAWEVAYRISHLDLNGAGADQGDVTNHTFGLNWYLNPYSRLMFNYVNSEVRRSVAGTVGDMNIVETRFQVDF